MQVTDIYTWYDSDETSDARHFIAAGQFLIMHPRKSLILISLYRGGGCKSKIFPPRAATQLLLPTKTLFCIRPFGEHFHSADRKRVVVGRKKEGRGPHSMQFR